MSSIKRLEKQLLETEKRIQEKKEEIELSLGQEIIISLELDYDDLNLVKDRKEMSKKIKDNLRDNFYNENSNSEQTEKTNTDNNNDKRENHSDRQQFNNH